MSTTYYDSSFNQREVLSESKRIIKAHSRHFLALSVLFLLPLSFSPIFYATLQSQSDSVFNRYTSHQSFFFFSSSDTSHTLPNQTELLLHLLYFLFSFVLTLVAYSTITYSTFNGFYGKPVKLISSIKSVLYNFLPLLSTFIIFQIIINLIVLFFTLLVALILGLLDLGFGIDLLSNKNYVMGFVFLLGIVVFVSLFWLQVNWSLWAVIVVVESKWGYEPLRRSRYLVNGKRGVAFSLQLLYGPAIGLFVWNSYICTRNAGQASGWISWTFVLVIIVMNSAFIAMFMLHSLAANVVLYMYCKAFHGEVSLEIPEEEFANDYISLPFDCEKVPHVVSVVQV